ncbi:N-formylglutamate amidohydrolase [Temperatibacter marinus]|uniref:N-formylglutamate amidohydrolase n=1 Tax=Temperatibacter marinus TaxID=1456591 RepID=A0AA52EG15_9PROT|nr:N-formylglutamate amidohydrolase [Temperatibacter marinus]WND01849.1 N-formylglutamate amidohydrolase [Temperatibacter marinus]
MTNTNILPPEVINPESECDVLILCDHASNHVPKEFDSLGLEEMSLAEHIAWDIGAEQITRKMCDMMGMTAVIQRVSRLVIDVNREPGRDSLIPVVSDGTAIPGNRNLSFEQTQNRVEAYYTPFHQVIEECIAHRLKRGRTPLIIGMHSFTDRMAGFQRPWQIGFLWNKDPRLAQAMIGMLERETTLTIGDNEPYSGKDLYYTMQRHGADNGLAQTTIEIRQDLAKNEKQCTEWAALLCDVLEELLERSDLMSLKHY